MLPAWESGCELASCDFDLSLSGNLKTGLTYASREIKMLSYSTSIEFVRGGVLKKRGF